MNKTLSAVIFISIFFAAAPLSAASEPGLYLTITECSRTCDRARLLSLSSRYLESFPEGPHVPHARHILAVHETSPLLAADRLAALTKDFPAYEKSDEALLHLCQVLHLASEWERLRRGALQGIKRHRESPFHVEFRFFLILSCMELQRYDEAAEECASIMAGYHNYRILSRALLSAAVISRYRSGYSREYLRNLRDLLLGFKDSEAYPSALFLTGGFYEKKEDYDRAYSAYSYLVKQYPRSIESGQARKKIDELARHSPRTLEFIPGEEAVTKLETLDLSPGSRMEGRESVDGGIYAVSIGPVASAKGLEGIKKIAATYGETKTIRLKAGYMIYVGKLVSTEEALNLKIRLAEEYGINGRIVRISRGGGIHYIYGE